MYWPKLYGLCILLLIVITYGFGWVFNYPGVFWVFSLVVLPVVSIVLTAVYAWFAHEHYRGE